jgi:YaaC-like Protein
MISASLEQFEELLDAARSVGPATRPLPLYYALSQAGRAIAAARRVHPWRLRFHGLTLLDDSGVSLPEREVRHNRDKPVISSTRSLEWLRRLRPSNLRAQSRFKSSGPRYLISGWLLSQMIHGTRGRCP